MDDKKIEVLKEELKVYLEFLRNITILVIAVGGGTIGLLFKLSNPIAIPLVFIGSITFAGFIIAGTGVILRIREIVKELQKWERKS